MHEFELKTRMGVTKVQQHKRKLKLLKTTAIPRIFLDARAAERAESGRAPLGESRGEFQKIAEIPLALLFAKIPPNAWEDQEALRKLVNDPEFAAFRSDREGRKF